MDWKKEWKILLGLMAAFLACYYLPVGHARFAGAVMESLLLVKSYAREHVLLCLVPALFIAGAIGVFVSQASVMKYLGARANRVLAYGVASVSGTILAVCSCTVLPLFAGIYKMGAGLGPATAFLYSGPAINVLAIVLTARVLGLRLGFARAVGAILFGIVIGLLMHMIFRKEEAARTQTLAALPPPEPTRPLWKVALYFASMVAILVFANWARTGDVRAAFLCCPNGLRTELVEGRIVETTDAHVRLVDSAGKEHKVERSLIQSVTATHPQSVQERIYRVRWPIVALCAALLGLMLIRWFKRDELREWGDKTWGFAKQIVPLLFIGVLVSGLLFGRPGHEGLIPSSWIAAAVGGNSLLSNFVASFLGTLMYFATLTEIPILQGLIGSGMGQGPALALLLAGPALSLPSMLVLRSIMGTKKTVVYVTLVVGLSTVAGIAFGWMVR